MLLRAEESEDTLSAYHSFTGYEPNVLIFGEFNDSSVPCQDVDDVTFGKLLTEAHQDKPIIAIQKACQSVSRRLLCSMDQGNLMEREMSTNLNQDL